MGVLEVASPCCLWVPSSLSLEISLKFPFEQDYTEFLFASVWGEFLPSLFWGRGVPLPQKDSASVGPRFGC